MPGFIDCIANYKVIGWACSADGFPVRVEILADDAVINEVSASNYREDLLHAGVGTGHHGFEAVVPESFWGSTKLSARIKTSNEMLVDSTVRNSQRHKGRYLNSILAGEPAVTAGFSASAVNETDLVLAKEVIELSRSMPSFDSAKGSMWDIHANLFQKEMLALLASGDAAGLAQFMVSLPRQPIAEGFLQGESAFTAFSATSAEGIAQALGPTKDQLVSLSQYLGCSRLESAEQGALGVVINDDTDTLASAISAALGFKFPMDPYFDGLLGIVTAGCVLTDREIQALYAAHRAKSVADKESYTICEIGGGAGLAAYYSSLLGAKSITLVDLPLMTLIQYFNLRRLLPNKTIAFLIDPESKPVADINIVSAALFSSLSEKWQWDVILNCDSFPEMGDQICSDYLVAISGRTKKLLSINQEANCPLTANVYGPRQPVVRNIVANFSNFKPAYRFRSWIRHGYAEELWKVTPA
jgi:hypothetical protein